MSIVILNWNGIDLNEECIDSVLKTDYHPFEIIFVDNGSTDGSLEIIKAKYPSIKFVENKENIGYAGGNNRGAQSAAGEYIVTLNNDVVVDHKWISNAMNIFSLDAKIGAVSCRQMEYYRKEYVDGLFHYPRLDLQLLPVFEHQKTSKKMPTSGYVIAANGGAAIYKSEMWSFLGGLDSRFFAYFEETDLCMRGFLHGWKCAYSADSIVYHKGSQSFKKKSNRQFYYRERNRYFFLYKNFPLLILLLHFPFLLIYEFRALRYSFIKVKMVNVFFESRWDAICNFKKFISDRKKNSNLFWKKYFNFYGFLLFKQKKLPNYNESFKLK